ncbi:MAG: acyl-CoA reductase [Oscillospiraceae bacterium]|nr:acyl-CoA reductase [Oscillospiraceae bacterium]
MILAGGELFGSSEQNKILNTIEERINHTLSSERLDREKVVAAADRLGKMIADGEFDQIIKQLSGEDFGEYVKTAAMLMKRENIEYRVAAELGADFKERHNITPPYGIKNSEVRFAPLGTLFHIAAGNVDGLPAFSVLEGLLTGNINILKLPEADNGLSVEIFKQLIKIEPALKNFIYVFDTSSADVFAMKKMAEMSDGIVVWGGDSAVKAVRTLAPAGAKIIEWGHKLGFAYVSGYEDKAAELTALANHIISTRQLFCSSCQTIFVNTADGRVLERFCTDFLPYLEKALEEYPISEIGVTAEITLRKYNSLLETAIGAGDSGKKIFRGKGCSLIISHDSSLELSYMYGNCLVKSLPEREIMSVLRNSKGYLQTAGLVCERESRSRLTELLVRSGVNRVMRAGNMSVSFCGEAHDGEYPLRRYMRVVNIEK